jgi:aspartokinase/homoserine dehydrogenase 1
MKAVARETGCAQGEAGRAPAAKVAVVLLGTGVVGAAFLELLTTSAATSLALVGIANSRFQRICADAPAEPGIGKQLAGGGDVRDNSVLLQALDASGAETGIVIDATASADLATQHATWLARGYHVVTANKAANGGSLARWTELQRAQSTGGTRYGDAATVGAGLPVIAALRRLHACGDRLRALEGVFSGSLGWLFSTWDGRQRFSQRLRRARELGYAEPDPRMDLSGEDVARKLLILARAAGFALSRDKVAVENLVPESLREFTPDAFLAGAEALDAPLAARRARAAARGCVLRYLARLDAHDPASIGLTELAADHPAAALHGTDNQFIVSSARYLAQPLIIQGPGAGADVTAQALLGDVLAIAE